MAATFPTYVVTSLAPFRIRPNFAGALELPYEPRTIIATDALSVDDVVLCVNDGTITVLGIVQHL